MLVLCLHQATALKKLRLAMCYAEPPQSPVGDFIRRHPELKLTQAKAIEPERHEAASQQHIADWFLRMENELKPQQ